MVDSGGLILGEYSMDRTIGRGTFGTVKLGIHIRTGKQMAIKIIFKGKRNNGDKEIKDYQDTNDPLYREVCIMRKVSHYHPHIVKLYEIQDTPHYLFLYFELCDGGELFEYICRKGKILEPEARKIYQQIISGLSYCHSHRVAHRDLKPENILLDRQNNIKIGDFGLGNFEHHGSSLTTYCGSPNYAAPEIIAGNPYTGQEVDVWSSGIILYAMLCGYLPFDNPNRTILFERIKSANVKIPGFLSNAAICILKKIIVANPKQRLTLRDIRHDPWFRQNIPGYMKYNFPYKGNPPVRSLLKRRLYLMRFGIPNFTEDELKTEFNISLADRRKVDSIKMWKYSYYNHDGQREQDEDSALFDVEGVNEGSLKSFSLLERNENPLDLNIIQSLKYLKYDLPNPVQNISSNLKSFNSKETVAYHILNNDKNNYLSELRPISIAYSSLLGITYRHFEHSLPNFLTERQISLIKQSSSYFVKKETSRNVTKNDSLRGSYFYDTSEQEEINSDEINNSTTSYMSSSSEASFISSKEEDTVKRNIPYFSKIMLFPNNWYRCSFAFPNTWQRKSKAITYLKRDITRFDNKFLTPKNALRNVNSKKDSKLPHFMKRNSNFNNNIAHNHRRMNKDIYYNEYLKAVDSVTFSTDISLTLSILISTLKSLNYQWKQVSYGKFVIYSKLENVNNSEIRNEKTNAFDLSTKIEDFHYNCIEPTSVQMITVSRVEINNNNKNSNDVESETTCRHMVSICHIQGKVLDSIHISIYLKKRITHNINMFLSMNIRIKKNVETQLQNENFQNEKEKQT